MRKNKKTYALFMCSCGNKKEIRKDHVYGGRQETCGECRKHIACERCGIHDVYAKSLCEKCYKSSDRSENREKYLAYGKEYRKNNPSYMTQYRNKNKDRIRLTTNAWRRNNRDSVSASQKKRRAKITNVRTEYIYPAYVFAKHNWKCAACGIRTPSTLVGSLSKDEPTLDHIIPISKGGSHSEENLQCLCRSCNSSKQAKSMSDFLESDFFKSKSNA